MAGLSIPDLKARLYERVNCFVSTPRTLPGLIHARYRPRPRPRGTNAATKAVSFNLGDKFRQRKNRPHQIRSEHRNSCALVLNFLIRKLDLETLECYFVAPSYNRQRPLYIAEIARHTGLCDRTITRTLGSLERGGYLLRTFHQAPLRAGDTVRKTRMRLFLTGTVFRDLRLDIAVDLLRRRMQGLRKKRRLADTPPAPQKPAPAATAATPPATVEAQAAVGYRPAPPPVTRSEESKAIGLQALAALRRKRPS